MKDVLETHLKPRDYALNEVYRIINRRQYTLFTKHNVYPIDICHSFDGDGNDILVFVYDRNDCKEVFDLWNKRELR